MNQKRMPINNGVPINNVDLTECKNLYFAVILVIIDSAKNHQWMLKSLVKWWSGSRILCDTQSQRITLIHRKKNNFLKKKPGVHQLNQLIQLNITSKETNWYHMTHFRNYWEYIITYVAFLPNVFNLNPVMRKQLYKFKLRDIWKITVLDFPKQTNLMNLSEKYMNIYRTVIVTFLLGNITQNKFSKK